MSRLVIVSNRLGDPSKPPSGGLAVALNGALGAMGGIWLGWNGQITSDEKEDNAPTVHDIGKITLVGVPLSQKEHDAYYLGYANGVLWPAFHHRADLIDTNPEFLESYRRVNRKFAIQLSKLIEPDDIIWVHDYHLIPLAEELRSMHIPNKMGFFLHIPVPPSQIMSAIPDHQWLVKALYAYDLVGFQTHADVTNFRLYAERQLGVPQDDTDVLQSFGRKVTVRAFPIGIDVDQFRGLLTHPDAVEMRRNLETKSVGRRWIVGVERLDYTKGLPERMEIFRRLLQKYPENIERSTLIQIAPPTREGVDAYLDIKEQLELLSGSVNGEFATIDWTPVRYIHRAVSRTRLAAVFSISRVGLVTPLRDGMNLVAKEYVAVQPDDDPGVLVLSEFAGAAEDMTEALLVNPYDTETTADQLQRALTMALDERRERHRALKKKVEDGNVVVWSQAFLKALEEA